MLFGEEVATGIATNPAIPASNATKIPLGFDDSEQFAQAVSELRNALSESGIEGDIGVRGSSVTGYSFKTGEVFNADSDIDFFVESDSFPENLRPSNNIPGFIHPDKIQSEYDAINTRAQNWSDKLGRDIFVEGFQLGKVPPDNVLWP